MGKPTRAAGKPIDQVCAIPFRRSSSAPSDPEFCLITSLAKRRWIFPKGIVEPGESEEAAALKEAWEEAGLTGTILPDRLGKFEDQKWGSPLTVQVVLMQVAEAAPAWPEAGERDRAWASADEALKLLRRDELKTSLRAAVDRIRAADLLPTTT